MKIETPMFKNNNKATLWINIYIYNNKKTTNPKQETAKIAKQSTYA